MSKCVENKKREPILEKLFRVYSSSNKVKTNLKTDLCFLMSKQDYLRYCTTMRSAENMKCFAYPRTYAGIDIIVIGRKTKIIDKLFN